MSALSVTDLAVRLGAQPVLRGIDLEIEAGEFVVLAGPQPQRLRLRAGRAAGDPGHPAGMHRPGAGRPGCRVRRGVRRRGDDGDHRRQTMAVLRLGGAEDRPPAGVPARFVVDTRKACLFDPETQRRIA